MECNESQQHFELDSAELAALGLAGCYRIWNYQDAATLCDTALRKRELWCAMDPTLHPPGHQRFYAARAQRENLAVIDRLLARAVDYLPPVAEGATEYLKHFSAEA